MVVILHSARHLPFAVTISPLDPTVRRLITIVEMLTRITPRIVAPSDEVWVGGAVMAGILARSKPFQARSS
jgi:hypothetical protein